MCAPPSEASRPGWHVQSQVPLSRRGPSVAHGPRQVIWVHLGGAPVQQAAHVWAAAPVGRAHSKGVPPQLLGLALAYAAVGVAGEGSHRARLALRAVAAASCAVRARACRVVRPCVVLACIWCSGSRSLGRCEAAAGDMHSASTCCHTLLHDQHPMPQSGPALHSMPLRSAGPQQLAHSSWPAAAGPQQLAHSSWPTAATAPRRPSLQRPPPAPPSPLAAAPCPQRQSPPEATSAPPCAGP